MSLPQYTRHSTYLSKKNPPGNCTVCWGACLSGSHFYHRVGWRRQVAETRHVCNYNTSSLVPSRPQRFLRIICPESQIHGPQRLSDWALMESLDDHFLQPLRHAPAASQPGSPRFQAWAVVQCARERPVIWLIKRGQIHSKNRKTLDLVYIHVIIISAI